MDMDRLRPKSFKPSYPRWLVGKPLLIMSSALASLGDAMFGYSQGAIAAVQVQPPFIKRFFGRDVTMEQIRIGDTGVNPELQAITVSCLNLSALVAALGAAYVCDVLGRRMSVRIGGIIYLIASFFQIFASNLAVFIVGRLIQGVAVGMLSMTVPILQCEIAPGHSRGLFISIEYLCLNFGYLLSSWVGYGFFFALPSEISWRGPYIIQAALAVILIAWSFVLPETPRFLISNGFEEEGLRVLADLHAAGNEQDEKVQISFKEIRAAVERDRHLQQASWRELFTDYTRRTIMGITCQMFAQFNGINAILYFLPSNLTRAGFSISKALLYSGVSAIVYCLGTIPTMFLIDRWGRRPFFIVGSFGLAACLGVVGGLQFKSRSLPVGNARIPYADGIFAAICVYLFFFGATWGPAPYLLGAEIFPMRARAKGVALSTTSNWLCNFIIAFVTPPLFAAIHGGFYFILLGLCVISGIFVYFVYPETAHRTLEELGEVFGDKGGAEEELKADVLLTVPGSGIQTSDNASEATTLRPSFADDSRSAVGSEKGKGA
ncbi:general substrate transporter [Laetiporus sulphureus 93-53]|uniref:General substrate transporter n=1 Tax=Laetiporus sulphureus 93-53 TaxID=1314785 RepID=A0A165FUU7_9APHY|nr:general substrate transporter [Laetiporus sulphureus 93-53]KZT09441.1 general substrate transporter [Laetiporus sulphureus 93-53]